MEKEENKSPNTKSENLKKCRLYAYGVTWFPIMGWFVLFPVYFFDGLIHNETGFLLFFLFGLLTIITTVAAIVLLEIIYLVLKRKNKSSSKYNFLWASLILGLSWNVLWLFWMFTTSADDIYKTSFIPLVIFLFFAFRIWRIIKKVSPEYNSGDK
ncbi:MAG: hypothetical protein V1853_00315 [bacterium]